MKVVKKVQIFKVLRKNIAVTVIKINCKTVNSKGKIYFYSATVLKYNHGITGINKVNQNFQYITKKKDRPTACKVVINISNKC